MSSYVIFHAFLPNYQPPLAKLKVAAAHMLSQVRFVYKTIGRYDFGLFWNFITGKQGLLCVTETWRYGYKRDYGDRVETPHGTTIGCEKSSNGLKKRIFLLLSTLLR